MRGPALVGHARAGAVPGGRVLLSLALALALAGCGQPAVESPSPQPSEGVEASAPESTPASTAKPLPGGGPSVYTDYSKLEDRDAAAKPSIYERWHGEFTDHLIPSPDYGPLIPFSGPSLADAWSDGAYCLEGLMTLDGKVVVDPVYASITPLGWGGYIDFGIMDGYHPAFLLSRYVGEGSKGDPGSLFGAYGDVRSRLCAADGSWVTGEYRFGYTPLCYGYVPEEGGLFALREGNVLVMLDMDTGSEVFAVTLDGLGEEELDDVPSCASYSDGRVTLNTPIHGQNYTVTGRSLYCWDLNGNEIAFPDDVDDIDGFSEGLCPARQLSTNLWGYLDTDGRWAIPPQFSRVWAFDRGAARVELADGFSTTLFIDPTGAPLHSGVPTYDHVERSGDYWYFSGYSRDVGLVVDGQGNELPSPALHGGSVDVLNYGWAVMDQPDRSQLLIRGTESWPIPAMWDHLWSRSVTENAIFLTYSGEYAPGDSRPRWLMWRPGDGDVPHLYDPRVRLGSLNGPDLDPVTGKPYLDVWNDDGTHSILTLEGEPLFEGLTGWLRLYGGRCLTSETNGGSRTVELLGQDGAVLFRRTWETLFD